MMEPRDHRLRNRDSSQRQMLHCVHSVRHLVHTSALHINFSGCERTLEHSAHFSSSKIDRLYMVAKGGLGSCKKGGGETMF